MLITSLRFIIILVLISLQLACINSGPTVKIETNKPAEDFIIECEWWQRPIIHGGNQRYSSTMKVLSSDEEHWCGVAFGFLHVRSDVSYRILHPTYSRPYRRAEHEYKMLHWKEKNVHVKEMYESGYWDKRKDPLDSYLSALARCGISKEYLKHYSKLKPLDYRLMKQKYYDDILECNKEREAIIQAHNKSSNYFYFRYDRFIKKYKQCKGTKICRDSEYRPDLFFERQQEGMWGSDLWCKFLEGGEEDCNRAIGQKKTYLVVYSNIYDKDPESISRTIWFLMDAYSKEAIKKKYPEFKPVDNRPNWMSENEEKSYTRMSCDGSVLHWDIEKPATGWLLDYEKGIFHERDKRAVIEAKRTKTFTKRQCIKSY